MFSAPITTLLARSPPYGCYNFKPSNTAQLRAALNTGGIIGCIGTSITAGYGCGTGNPPVTGAQPLSWPAVLADNLTALGFNAKQTARWGDSNYGSAGAIPYDPRLTLASTNWNVSVTGPGGSSWLNSADSAAYSFNPGFQSNTATAWYQRNTGFATWQCDVGGVQVSSDIVANSTANAIVSVTMTTTLANNTWDLHRKSSATGNFRIEGIEAYDSTIPNLVRIWAMGWGGSGTTQWIPTSGPTTTGSVLETLPFDCTFVELTGNDMHQGLSHEQARSQLTTMAGLVTAQGGNCILVVWPAESTNATPEATQLAYDDDVVAVATNLDLPWMSQRAWLGGSYAANPSYYTDSVHVGPEGQARLASKAAYLFQYLRRVPWA